MNMRRDQRLAMYIVTSKPKRRSVAAGVVQAMMSLLNGIVVVGIAGLSVQHLT